MDSAMFTTLKAENIPFDSSNWSHCCSASYAMLSNGLHEDSCQFSDLAQLLVHSRGSALMPSLAVCQENSIKKSGSQQTFPAEIDQPSSLVKFDRIRADCYVRPFVLPPIPEHEPEGPVGVQSESSIKTILVRKSSVLDLIKYSSLPGELLSRLSSDETNQRLVVNDTVGNFYAMAPPMAASSGSGLKSIELVQQSSCPDGVLAQFSGNPIDSTLVAEKLTSQGGLNRSSSNNLGNDFIVDSVMENKPLTKRGRKDESQMIKFEAQATDSWHMMQGQIQSGSQYTVPRNLMTDNMPVDVVLCKSRAKRGCATHPRSIAERVRRTKISERMKKLYDLLPNMDKQVHTADMLDEVVEYVKQLQRQFQELSGNIHPCCTICHTKEEQPS